MIPSLPDRLSRRLAALKNQGTNLQDRLIVFVVVCGLFLALLLAIPRLIFTFWRP